MENSLKNKEIQYYDGLKFHRVITDFMIQGWCPMGLELEILDINLMMNFTLI